MKKLTLILGLLLATMSFVTTASEVSSDKKETVRESWTCTAYGTLNLGYPGGSMTMTVIGRGDSQLNAMSDAQQRCFSQGLQMCMVNNCYKR